ncbi:MAG: TonB family protein [Hyphomicrobium sp.]|nr:TonB family protein [Hyphomicrobium sp.]
MISLRTIAVSLSLLVHGSLAYAVIWRPPAQPTDVLESGSGTDAMNVEAGIAIEGLAKLGDALETIETVEIAPVNASPPPPEDIKPVDELHDAITATDSPSEAPIAEVKEPPPVVEQVPPPEVQVQERAPDQVAILSQQSSGEAKSGSDAKAYGRYMGQINQRVQRAKINPRARIGGTVLMRFTVGLRGELLKTEVATSSGSPLLDKAAISALERAAPFPPIPPEVSTKPLAFTQPFRFIMR